MNQLTRRANEGRDVPREELQNIQRELHILWQQFNSAIQK
ncbi:hypothetical protein [Bacillus cereus]